VKRRLPRSLLAVQAGILALLAGLGGAAAADFVPHRAIYGLALAKQEMGSTPVVAARGKLEFEWADVCDGWAVRQRSRIIVTHQDGSEIDFGWTLNSWESKDGLSYKFFIRRLHASGEEEEVRGTARLDGPGAAGTASYELPKEEVQPLPKGTVFPTEHSLAVLAALENGTMPLWKVMFDGSGEEGLFGINAALAQSLPAGTKASLKHPLLDETPSWRVLVAYFGLKDVAAEPEYEQEMRLFANGVVDELLLDYGDFTLDAELVDLVALPPPAC